MEAQNSWVVVDWQENRHFKFEAIAYVVSLSPIFKPLTPLLRLPPVMSVGTKFYQTIASNRKTAGKFTAPLKFRPLEVHPSRTLNILTLLLLVYITVWNIRGFVELTTNRGILKSNISKVSNRIFKSKTLNSIDWISRLLRIDQSWSIFAPAPPRDDGWYVIPGKLKNGRTIDILKDGEPVSWEKPSIRQRNAMYPNMQWRSYFINLNRAIGRILYPYYGPYICRKWNAKHQGSQQLDSFEIDFMKEETVPPGQQQTVEKTQKWQQSCSDENLNPGK
jgi:hypothetical protein